MINISKKNDSCENNLSAGFLKWSTPDRKSIGFNQIFYFLFRLFIYYANCHIL